MEDQKKAILLIKLSMKYVKKAHDDAELKHDSYYGEQYMDYAQYEIMQETEALLEDMSAFIKKFEAA